jgi:DNA-binding CsgD family transcriptional regulator
VSKSDVKEKVTPNEEELLEKLAAGQMVQEVATEWGVHQRSVYRTLTKMRRRVNARTDLHLMAIWLNRARDGAAVTAVLTMLQPRPVTPKTNGHREQPVKTAWPRCKSCSGPASPNASDGLCMRCATNDRFKKIPVSNAAEDRLRRLQGARQ